MSLAEGTGLEPLPKIRLVHVVGLAPTKDIKSA